MRILMVSYTPVGKGTYWRALPLARHLAQRGHDVVILATPRHRSSRFDCQLDDSGALLVSSPDLLGGPFRFGWDPINVLARMLWSPSGQVDIIHGFESRPTVICPALRWRRRYSAPLVLDWCDWFGREGSVEERSSLLLRTIVRPFETHFEEAYRARADGATVINTVLEHRARQLGVQAERLLNLPNGCNTDDIYPVSSKDARNAVGLAGASWVVGYLGDLFRRDATLLAEAFEALLRRNPDARLLMIGDASMDVRALVSKPAAVLRTGRVPYDRIKWYLGACDVCWLALRNSTANRGRTPMKLSDYMAAGRPIVTTDVGDLGRTVRDGRFGLVASDTPQDLADKTAVLFSDPEARAAMGGRARAAAESGHSWGALAERLEGHYQTLIELQAKQDDSR